MADYVNFFLGCCPNWAELSGTLISAGGEAPLRGADWQKTRLMSQVWRTPSLKPRHTQEVFDFGAGGKPSRALFVGNINVPDEELLVRIRKDNNVTDERVRPLYRTNGVGTALLSATNASGSIDGLDTNPYLPEGAGVTPTSPGIPMDFRVPLRSPVGLPAVGSRLHSIQVSYQQVSAPAAPGATASITVTVWQAGSATALSKTEVAFTAGEDPTWVTELKFDASDLPDPTGSSLQVRVHTVPGDAKALKVAAVSWLCTPKRRVGLPHVLPAFLAATNANTTDPQLLEGTDVFDSSSATVGVSPTVATSPLDFRVGFSDPGPLSADTSTHAIAVRFQATLGTAGSITVTVWAAGSATSRTATATASGGSNPQWVLVPFSLSDLGAGTSADVQARVVTTPSGSNNVSVKQVQWIASLDQPACSLDTGWFAPFPSNVGSLWGIDHFTGIGKPIQRSFYVLFFDDSGTLQTIQTRYTRIEFALSSGSLSFTDDFGKTTTWMDVGRYAEGPGVSGPNLAIGFEPGLNDPSTIDLSDGGIRWEDDEMVYKELTLKLSQLKGLVASSDFYEVFQRLGKTSDVLLVVFPGNGMSRSFWTWGPLSKEGGVSHEFGTVFRGNIQTMERV